MTVEPPRPRVVYADPPWALDRGGRPDAASADLEREIYGPGVDLRLGVFDGGYVTSGERFVESLRGADALVVHRCRVTPEVVEALAGRCRVVARSGVGVDNLNRPLLDAAGIASFNVPDYCGDEVGTHALALLLALERGISLQDRAARSGGWDPYRGGRPRRTAARAAGIVGFGRIGRATSRKLQPFYGRVLAYDPYVQPDVMAAHGVEAVPSLAGLLAAVDAVVLHAELTAETRAMIGRDALARVREGTLLVNVARGALVDPDAVLEALETGRLGGFASDVFSPENPSDTPVGRKLLERDDVVVTAHRAYLSVESEASSRRRVALGVRAALSGAAPAVPRPVTGGRASEER